jgi:PAS domain-containing protein|tara:strand:+ start:524 stop:919 length:396 start_codon:yes stop_codon:yes gene_type:complete
MIAHAQVKRRRLNLLKAINPESRFYHLFDCVPGLSFFAKDRDGVLLAANRHLIPLYGFESKEAFIGHTDFELPPRYLAEKYRRDDRAIMERRESATKPAIFSATAPSRSTTLPSRLVSTTKVPSWCSSRKP